MNILKSFVPDKCPRAVKHIFLLTSALGLALSIMSVTGICTSACSDLSLYTIFGIQFGWFGILYFGTLLGLLSLHSYFSWAGMLYVLLIYAAVGAELRFIWIQKFIVGTWCYLCLAIASVVFLTFVVVLMENWKILRLEIRKMKTFLKYTIVMIIAAVLGLTSAILGVKGHAEAKELNYFLGKKDSATVVYFINDWFCPACRRVEPTIEKMFPKIAEVAKVTFIDIPVHPETSNFTPYNLQFLVYEKTKYIQLHKALSELSMKTGTPSSEDIQTAIAPYGVKLREMNFTDILSGMKWNETIYRSFEIRATPTVVVSNTKSGKHVKLVGENEISYGAIIKAIAAVGK